MIIYLITLCRTVCMLCSSNRDIHPVSDPFALKGSWFNYKLIATLCVSRSDLPSHRGRRTRSPNVFIPWGATASLGQLSSTQCGNTNNPKLQRRHQGSLQNTRKHTHSAQSEIHNCNPFLLFAPAGLAGLLLPTRPTCFSRRAWT